MGHATVSTVSRRCDTLITVDDHVAVRLIFSRHDHDGRLLAALGQRRQQSPLPSHVANSEMPPSPVELVKLQLYQTG